ncbi:MAG: DUF2807 domain-containing protein [Tannerellaceae bacterium]|nr:DUF2807 domain-containing protein [Tannerellaceae bacterium]
MKAKTLLLLVCLWIGNIAGAQVKVTGNGDITTREFDIIDYNRIHVNGFFDVIYEQVDADPYLEITLDDNLMPFVDVEIKDRQLNIKFKGIKVEKLTTGIIKTNSKWLREIRMSGNGGFKLQSPVKGDELVIKGQDNSLIELKQPLELGKLDLNSSGSANIIVESLVVDNLNCNISGSGSLKLVSGEAKHAIYNIKNNGLIQAYGVEADEVIAKVTAGGTMEIFAKEKLSTNTVGNAIIRYKGNPHTLQNKKIGKGTVDRIED